MSKPVCRLRRRAVLRMGLAAALPTLSALTTPRAVSAEEPPAAIAGEREEFLVREACRYLNLSRSQLSLTLALARQTDRRRSILEQEDAEARRKLNALALRNPEEGAALRKSHEEARKQAFAQIVTQVAPQWARALTREQIALAVRLAQGTPPKYAGANSALLEPDAGFSRGSIDLLFRTRVLQERDPRAAGVYLEDLEVELAPASGAQVPEEVAREALQRALIDLDGAIGRRFVVQSLTGDAQDRHPFAQRVLETNDLTELAGWVSPLAERLFSSPQLVPVLQDALAQGLEPAAPRPVAPSGPPRLVRDYRMEQGLRDLSGRGPELDTLGGSIDHGRYVFGAGQGLELENCGVTDHYAVELLCRYFGGDGYQKILDFKGGTADDGLYFFQGHLTFYTLADGGTPLPGQEHRLRLDRNRATRVVRCTLDGAAAFSFLDLDDQAVFDKGFARFFVDDKTTSNEQGPGELRALMVWSSPVRR